MQKRLKRAHTQKKQYIEFYGASCQADRDLLCSIGAVSSFVMRVQYVSENKKYKNYKVSIAVIDKYDFRLFGKNEKTIIVRLINNYGGYYPMKLGVINIYYWSAYCEFNYSIKK